MILKFSKWILFLTFVAIFLVSKSYTISNFGFRPEDIPAIFSLFLLPFIYIKISKLISKKLQIAFFLYFFYILSTSLLQGVEFSFNILVIYFKELSYFCYFLISLYFFHSSSNRNLSQFLALILILTVPNILYLYYQLFSGNIVGMYGVSLFGHNKSPASSGLICLLIFYLVFIYRKFFNSNFLVTFYLISVAIILFFIGSKIAVVGFLTFILMMTLLERNAPRLMLNLCAIVLIVFLLNISINSGIGALHRLDQVFSPIDAIMNRGIWFKIEWIEGLRGLIFGGGLKMGHIDSNLSFVYGMSMDNQILYYVIVTGIIGLCLTFYMLSLLILAYPKGSILRKMQISIIFSYFAMGMGAETFQLSISGITFWFFSGFLYAFKRKSN